ncbi:MAG: hypothetical protein LBQ60_11210 [Bacteroidales bacterium]|jgi:hypothetical protein|nr:hypothetical protein [Bacteroidales bacterium]
MKTNQYLPLSISLLLLISFSLLSCQSDRNAVDKLAAEFENPPLSVRPGSYWCWLNGNMTKEGITRDLEAMKSKGMNGAEIWDVAAIRQPGLIPAGESFMGDQSVALIKHTISEGKRLQMRIGMVASSGWNAGGSWVTPDWASKALYFSEVQADGPGKISLELPFPKLSQHCPLKEDGTPVFWKEVAVLAVPHKEDKVIDPAQVINLTPFFSGEKLNWEVPEGKWDIIRFVCSNNGQHLIVPSPNSNGLFIDFFDPEATKRHLKYFLDRLGITIENASESGFSYLEFDSMELDEGTPWTDKMPDIFKAMQGYSIENFLPVFTGRKMTNDQDQMFLYDFRKTISDQLIFSHYTTGSEFLEQYGIDLVAEAGGPGPPVWNSCPVDALKALGNVSIPRGEFWIKHRNMFLIKEIASASHIYGKNIVDAESFTTWRRWLDAPFELKKHVDRAYAEGLNSITFHTFASTGPEDGLPGRTYHAGLDMNTGTTWWEKSKPFMDYLSRCNYMLRQGLFVADVCYYYGDQAPNFFPLYHDVPEKPGLKGLSTGYDYDVVNSDVIINRMSIKNGRIALPDGMSYAVMILPEQEQMPLSVLKKIASLVSEGAVVIGPRPLSMPGLNQVENDKKEFRDISEKLWGAVDGKVIENTYGKGKVFYGISPDEVLKKVKISRDFYFEGTPALDYIHRTIGTSEIYFIRNEAETPAKGEAHFRVAGKAPEVWDPATGNMNGITGYKSEQAYTSFPVELPPHGSVFIVFNKSDRKLPAIKKPDRFSEQPLSPPWTVSFPDGWGAPPEVIFDQMQSWTESEDPGIKYFSGTATYRKTFTLPDNATGKQCCLNLGDVRELAEVFVNGKSAGILWKKPFNVDITPLVQPGENDLKIEVVNMWANRLSGDLLLKPEDRFCRTNQPWNSEVILPSGLLGPVTLKIGNE